jgi:signal transduction histidine kinase
MQEPAGADQRAHIEIAVDDDGKAGADLTAGTGMGLLGMRERIVALGGQLSMDASRGSGLVLRARIPVPLACARPSETRQAA